MEELKMMVPTYNGKLLETDPALPEFDEPQVPVLVRSADGVKIILGTNDYDDYTKADVQIERRHNGWMIFLHPHGGCDPSGCVVFLDDGRSFVAQEHECVTAGQIEMVEYEEAIAELDDVLPTGLSCEATMIVEQPRLDQHVERLPLETNNNPAASEPSATSSSTISEDVIDALERAQEAVNGDSNDDEHDALLDLIHALLACNLVAYRMYCPEWIVTDFCGWAGLDKDERPDQVDIDIYVREARPADSSPVDVHSVLTELVTTLPKTSADVPP